MESTPNDQPSSDTLEGWTRLFAKGDEAAWRWFHERYYLPLLRYAAHRSGNASAGSEIVQDAYLRIARHAKPFKLEPDFWGWLCCIVRCAALDHMRHITRRSTLLEKFEHWRASHTSDESQWHPSTNHSQALADEALAKLPADDAKLLRNKYGDGCTTKELASQLGVTAKAIEHRLSRLRAQLLVIILRIQ